MGELGCRFRARRENLQKEGKGEGRHARASPPTRLALARPYN